MQRDWSGTDGYLLPVKHTCDLVAAFEEIDRAKAANTEHFEARRHFKPVDDRHA